MKKIFLTFILVSFININSHAKKDIVIEKKINNLNLYIKTSYYNEVINKVLIFGELANDLLIRHNYTEEILFMFKHKKIGDNFSKREFTATPNYILLIDDNFDILTNLKILECFISKNKKVIKFNYNDFIEISKNKNSILINKLLNKKIYRPNYVDKLNNQFTQITYYFQNNQFQIIRNFIKKEYNLFKIKDIFQFKQLDTETVIVFENRNLFKYYNLNKVNSLKEVKFSSKLDNYYLIPYHINKISKNLITITDVLFKQNILVYVINENIIIKDLNSILGL
jgi:hypothetical protein